MLDAKRRRAFFLSPTELEELAKFRVAGDGFAADIIEPNRTVQSGPRKGSKMRRRGVTVRVRKDKPRQLVQGGWHAKGHILRRKDRGDNDSQPIMRFGPSIPEMVANSSVIEAAQDLVRKDLPEQFSNRLDYILNRKAGRL